MIVPLLTFFNDKGGDGASPADAQWIFGLLELLP